MKQLLTVWMSMVLLVACGIPSLLEYNPSSIAQSEPNVSAWSLPPDDMAEIEGGTFSMGCAVGRDTRCLPTEFPVKSVDVKTFWIDRFEVTVAQFKECVDAGVCSAPPYDYAVLASLPSPIANWIAPFGTAPNWNMFKRLDHPMNLVDWGAATTYCQWRGKRLPTEEEWEFAAKGKEGRIYPWGDSPKPSCDQAIIGFGAYTFGNTEGGCGRGTTWPVGSRPTDVTPEGVYDMAGNVREVTSSPYLQYPSPRPEFDYYPHVVRGHGFLPYGRWWNFGAAYEQQPWDLCRTSSRSPEGFYDDIGFRCAQDPPSTAF